MRPIHNLGLQSKISLCYRKNLISRRKNWPFEEENPIFQQGGARKGTVDGP